MSKAYRAVVFVGVAAFLVFSIWLLIPPIFSLSPSSTRILDRHGTLLYEVRPSSTGSQKTLQFQDIPQQIITTLLAVEDRSFYMHPGVSLRGTLRATWENLKAGQFVQGGSTITQQLARQYLQPTRRTILYKIQEALYALKFDLHWSKQRIVTEYLNTVYFGHQAYGIAAAADTYFGKTVHELSLSETALLIGLLQSPSVLDPFVNRAQALNRRNIVLDMLLDQKIIEPREFAKLNTEPLHLAPNRIDIQAPHFVFWLLSELDAALEARENVSWFLSLTDSDDVSLSKLRNQETKKLTTITTTIDLPLQQKTERIINHHLAKLSGQNVTSAAVVILDAQTSEVLTMVGSADYFDTENDGAVNVALSLRQPGSALKPFTYALALSDGHTAASIVDDSPVRFITADGLPYTPRNYDFRYRGPVRYREALANSYNISAVKVLQQVGVDRLHTLLESAGITTLTRSPEHYGLALTLGAGEVTLLDLTRAYGVFARMGDSVLDPRVAWLISDILSDNQARVPAFGEQSPLAFGFPVAAKTGTTRNNRDNWVVGYTSERIVGAWVGNADSSPMRGTSGISGAGPIFHDVMQAAMQSQSKNWFPRPEGIVDREICRESGLLSSPDCPGVLLEHFIKGTEPTQIHRESRQQVSNNDAQPLVITQPFSGDRFLLDPTVPDIHEQVIFTARSLEAASSIDWYINDQYLSTALPPLYRATWQPVPGRHTIKAQSDTHTDSIIIEVISN